MPEFRKLFPTKQQEVVASTRTTRKQRKQELTPNIPVAVIAASVAPNREGGGHDSNSSDGSRKNDKPIGPFKTLEGKRDLADIEDER